MLTEEQRKKAQTKILEQEGIDISKHTAMVNHIKALHYFNRFKIPYRVCLDYIKRPKQAGEIELNDCYPLPGYPKDKLISVHYPQDFDKQEDNIYSLYGIYELDNLKADIKEQIAEHNKQFYNGNIFFDTEQADFVRLLEGYDLYSFNVFDWFGTRRAGTEDEDITDQDCKVIASVYALLVDGYKRDKAEHPQRYRKHKYTDKQLDNYQEQPFNIIWDTEDKGDIDL